VLPGASENDDCRVSREVNSRCASESPMLANCKKSCLPGYSMKSEPEAVATGCEHSIIEDLLDLLMVLYKRHNNFSDEAFIFS
jgi:hypothetical protein